jgi:hypothetical protein
VAHVHEFRCQKELLHPQLILRTIQAENAFYKGTLSQYEMCEAAIRNRMLEEQAEDGSFYFLFLFIYLFIFFFLVEV